MSLCALHSNCCKIVIKYEFMKISCGALVIMKGKKAFDIYVFEWLTIVDLIVVVFSILEVEWTKSRHIEAYK